MTPFFQLKTHPDLFTNFYRTLPAPPYAGDVADLHRLKIVVHFYFPTIHTIAIVALFVVVDFPA